MTEPDFAVEAHEKSWATGQQIRMLDTANSATDGLGRAHRENVAYYIGVEMKEDGVEKDCQFALVAKQNPKPILFQSALSKHLAELRRGRKPQLELVVTDDNREG